MLPGETYMKQNSRCCLQVSLVLFALIEQFLLKLLISVLIHRTRPTSGHWLHHRHRQVVPKLFTQDIHVELRVWL